MGPRLCVEPAIADTDDHALRRLDLESGHLCLVDARARSEYAHARVPTRQVYFNARFLSSTGRTHA
ncbi:MAG TPA: hypothetical protein VIO57_18410, partial [Chloroflexota bacterium]